MTRSGRINAPRVKWSQPELRRLAELYPDTRTSKIADELGKTLDQVYRKADKLGLKKSAAYLAGPDACRLRRGDQVGKPYQFPKGHVPANKGKKGQPSVGRMAETQFKKGHRGGKALLKYQPIGSERISKDGYLQRKVNDDMPFQGRWRGVHLINWEAINGPLPKGHALVFRDGNKQNVAPENMELVTRGELMRRNSYHTNYPKEVAQVIQLRGALVRKINKRSKKENEQRDEHRDHS